MEEECLFDFETEIMDQFANAQSNDYAAQMEEDLFYDDYAQGSVELETYDP